jgi:hypothetical protein
MSLPISSAVGSCFYKNYLIVYFFSCPWDHKRLKGSVERRKKNVEGNSHDKKPLIKAFLVVEKQCVLGRGAFQG